jgi:hypothetical protein
MIDVFNIPNSNQGVSIFYADGESWQTWQKPRNCQWVWIIAIGGGGGGAGGRVAVTTNGSSAGAAGATTRAMFNASHLPDTLFIQVALGGNGGASNTNGLGGGNSLISILPNTTATNRVLASGANSAGGGLTTGVSATGELTFLITNGVFGSLATFLSTQGASSQTSALSPSNVIPINAITTIGAQGAGYNITTPVVRDGGSVSTTPVSPRIPGGTGTIAASTDGGNGGDGTTSWKPFFSTGGAGGGNSSTGVGGNGGNGGIGSGGGAGGSSGVTGGRGGKGGDGIVMIVAV